MRILIDIDEAGHTHWCDLSPEYHKVEHPDGVTGLVDVRTMLQHHNHYPDDREKGGWHQLTQLPGETEPITKWQRLVRAVNHPDAPEELKALGLRE